LGVRWNTGSERGGRLDVGGQTWSLDDAVVDTAVESDVSLSSSLSSRRFCFATYARCVIDLTFGTDSTFFCELLEPVP
jgi:hypothetical protein